MAEPLLTVEDLSLSFRSLEGAVQALDRVSFHLSEGEVMGFVGESGSGKSVTSLAILGLLPREATVVTGGRVVYRGRDLLSLAPREFEGIRGKEIGMVFQSPGGSLNPLHRIERHLLEVLAIHRGLDGSRARTEALQLLERVGLPPWVMRSYPHELSGGMQQRAYIAIALACHPAVLIADEPTSALDVSVQAQILDLLQELHGAGLIRSILFITHDLGVVEALCDRVTVLYAGQVVETGPVADVLNAPRHPYTQGLIAAIPRMTVEEEALGHIPGTVPNLLSPPPGCRFHTRCEHAEPICRTTRPRPTRFAGDHAARCHLLEQGSAGHALG